MFSLKPALALAGITVIDALRRSAVLGLLLFGMLLILSTFFFYQFIPRDIGRFASDFVVSVSALIGFLFLFFHCVQTVSWDKEKGIIQSIMSRPLSRADYVLGLFFGLGFLLITLNIMLGSVGYIALVMIKHLVPTYFLQLSMQYFLLTSLSLLSGQLMLLAVILFFSSIMRGSFPVLLMALGYYFTCSGLPVVRESFQMKEGLIGKLQEHTLTALTLLFPDFSRFDYKTFITSNSIELSSSLLAVNFLFSIAYIVVFLTLASIIYQKRDLQ
jgi:ABC-type transport system involved in multi-copper enzyme maturation permease subunit